MVLNEGACLVIHTKPHGRLLPLPEIRHFDESETFGPTGVTVSDELRSRFAAP